MALITDAKARSVGPGGQAAVLRHRGDYLSNVYLKGLGQPHP